MKVSEVTPQIIRDSLGVTDADSDSLIAVYSASALSYIRGFTDLSSEEIDKHEDLTIAYLCLVGDMFVNRFMTVSSDKLNPTAKQILAMYSKNYL